MSEKLIFFGEENGLVGTLTMPEPTDAPLRSLAVVLFNSGFVHRVGPHRMNVRMARFFARAGYPALRFDFSGLGDSARIPSREDTLARSKGELVAALNAAAANTGVQRFVLVGLCSGTDHCINVAMDDSRVAGIVLLDPFAYPTWRTKLNYQFYRIRLQGSALNVLNAVQRKTLWTIKSKLKRSSDTSQSSSFIVRPVPPREDFEKQLGTALDRQVHTLAIYSGNFPEWYNYQGQFAEAHKTLGKSPLLTHEYIPEANHTFTELQRMNALFDRVMQWATRLG